MKFRLGTLFLVILPFAAFFAGVARDRIVTIHVGMTDDEACHRLRLVSAVNFQIDMDGDPTMGTPGEMKCWSILGSPSVIKTVTCGGQGGVVNLYLDHESVQKLTIHSRKGRIVASNELTEVERSVAERNRSLLGGSF